MRLPGFLPPLIILAVIVAVLVILLTVFPLKVLVEYEEPGLLIQIRLWMIHIPIVRRETPEQKAVRARKKREKKAKKGKKKKKKPKPPPDPKKKKARRTLLAGLAKRALEELTRKPIPLDKLWLDVTFGGDDPAKTALLFGSTHAALGAVWPAAMHFVDIKDRRIRTAVDFTLPAMRVDYFCLLVPLPLAKGISIGFHLLGWLLRRLRENRRQATQHQKEAV